MVIDNRFPWSPRPFTNVQPFNFRDQTTMLMKLEQIAVWLRDDIIPHINTEIGGLAEAWEANIQEIINGLDNFEESVTENVADQIATYAASLTALVSQVIALRDEIVGNSIELQAEVLAGVRDDLTALINQGDAATRDAITTALEPVSNALGDLETLTSDGRLSGASLDERYAHTTDLDNLRGNVETFIDGVSQSVAYANTQDEIAPAISSLYARGGGVVQLGPGSFTGPIQLAPGVSLKGAGKGATVINYSEGSHIISASGAAPSDLFNLTTDVTRGATTITVPSTTGIVPGDILVISDTVAYATESNTYRSGEQIRVKRIVSETVIEIYGTVRGSFATGTGSYTVANGAKLARLSLADGVSISDLTIKGNPNTGHGAITLTNVRNASIANVSVDSGGGFGFRVANSRDVIISGCDIRDLTDDVPNGIAGYAVTVDGPSENVLITGNMISRVRHGFTTQGTELGMPHNVVVSDNTLSDCTLAALDTHAAGDGILITGNNINTSACGISVRSRNTVVSDNLISNTYLTHAIIVAENAAQNITIVGNTIFRTGGTASAVLIRPPVQHMVIKDNTTIETGGNGIAVNAGCSHVVITGNLLKRCGVGTGSVYAIIASTPGAAGGTPPTTSWVIADNIIHQFGNTIDGAINTISSGLQNPSVSGNRAAGSFTGNLWEVGPLPGINTRMDQTPPAVTGSRGGNAALASLLSVLATAGIITNASS